MFFFELTKKIYSKNKKYLEALQTIKHCDFRLGFQFQLM